MKKHLFNKDNVIALIIVFVFFKLLGSIQLSVLDPIGDAFEDVELTDIVFSHFNKNYEYRGIVKGEQVLDTNVVIVNIGNLPRQEVAQLINRVNTCKPAAIGIDAFFEKRYRHQNKLDTIFDNMLANALKNSPNLVMVSRGESTPTIQVDTTYNNATRVQIDTVYNVNTDSSFSITKKKIEYVDTIINRKLVQLHYKPKINQYPGYTSSDSLFSQFATNALANVITELTAEEKGAEEFKVCRKILTHAKIKPLNDTIIECFALALVDKYNPDKAEKFRQRIDKKPEGKDKAEELINYTGNIFVPFQQRPKPRYRAFDIQEVFSPNFIQKDSLGKVIGNKEIEGKIVLFGFLGGNINIQTGEDKFFTPLNESYIGKANEDMYGVVVHANTITMILEDIYINTTPKWIGHVIGILLTYFCIGIFSSVYFEYKHWYDGLTKVLGVIIASSILFLIGLVFAAYNIKIIFPAIYFATMVLAGDLLEIYYGLLKNLVYKIRKKEIKEN